jgi:osmotically-inducible protein OsmY
MTLKNSKSLRPFSTRDFVKAGICFSAGMMMLGLSFRIAEASETRPSTGYSNTNREQSPSTDQNRGTMNRPQQMDQQMDRGNQDENIRSELNRILTNRQSLAESREGIEISSRNGVVTLEGEVRSSQDRQWIEAQARQISNVTRVDNKLRVANP